jgi:Tfp pilus assembly protein PilF
MRLPSFVVALLVIFSLAACSTTSVVENGGETRALTLDSDLFGERPNIASISAIHELSDEQRLAFERYFDNPDKQDEPAHRRVSDYLETVTSDFSYRGETFSASEALEHSAGNCLALAILTTALARLADVDIAYQLIDSAPVFESRGDQIHRGHHVRSKLYDPTWVAAENLLVFSRPGVTVDYFPSDFDRFIGNIKESEYSAMYFRNIAADAIADEDLTKAYWLLLESLELSPNNPDSLNMLAIVYDRSGDTRKSEEIYKFGIQNSPRQVSLLRNYGIFLRRQGRPLEAEKMDRVLSKLDDPNPFDWLYAGKEAYRDGEFSRAKRFFKKSIELAPYLHEGHFGLARTYFRMGNLTAAEQELAQALNNAYRPSTRSLYEAKLAVLSENREGNSP